MNIACILVIFSIFAQTLEKGMQLRQFDVLMSMFVSLPLLRSSSNSLSRQMKGKLHKIIAVLCY